jgi:hypothetical protein
MGGEGQGRWRGRGEREQNERRGDPASRRYIAGQVVVPVLQTTSEEGKWGGKRWIRENNMEGEGRRKADVEERREVQLIERRDGQSDPPAPRVESCACQQGDRKVEQPKVPKTGRQKRRA